MRPLILFAVLAAGGALSAVPQAAQDESDTVLAAMRQALGGSAALDAVQSFSATGSLTQRIQGRAKQFSLEMLATLPDNYLEIRRDRSVAGPMEIDITYYNGLRGDALIRRTDANVPFPPEPGPHTPEAIAERQRARTLEVRRAFARLGLVLFGRSFSGYPLSINPSGTAQRDGRAVHVIDARHADGYTMQLSIDASTQLPVELSWMGEPEVIMTTSTTRQMTVDGRGRVLSEAQPMPPVPPVQLPPPGAPGTERKMVFGEFRAQDGITWPRRWRQSTPNIETDVRLGRVRINPNINPRRFDIR